MSPLNVIYQDELPWLTLSVCVSISGAAIEFFILCQLFIANKNKFRSNKESCSNNIGLVLVTIYTFLVFLNCACHGLIQTNVFTGIHHRSFSVTWCSSGSVIYISLLTMNYGLLDIIFLHRIQSTFRGSIYAYPRWVYWTYLIVIVSVAISAWTLQFMNIFVFKFGYNLYVDRDSGFAFCTSDATINLSLVLKICGFFGQLMANLSLLCMFVHGLWRLNAGMIAQFMKNSIGQSPSPLSPSSISPAHAQVESQSVSTTGMDIVLEQWNRKHWRLLDLILHFIVQL